MSDLNIIGPGLDPNDLWRNFHYLEQRIKVLEEKVRALEAARRDSIVSLFGG
jgi:hypothetical protein